MSLDPNLQPTQFSYARSGIYKTAGRAGWLMVGLGILMLLGGALFVAVGFILPSMQLPPEQAKNLQQLETQLHASFKAVFVTTGAIVLATGVYHIVLGLIVRRGYRTAIYAAIVTSFLATGWCAISSINGLMYGAANAVAGVCFLFVIGAVFVWLLIWLFQALRRTGASAAGNQYQTQYWQTGDGAAAPPPQPPSPDPPGWAYGAQTLPPPPPPP